MPQTLQNHPQLLSLQASASNSTRQFFLASPCGCNKLGWKTSDYAQMFSKNDEKDKLNNLGSRCDPLRI